MKWYKMRKAYEIIYYNRYPRCKAIELKGLNFNKIFIYYW